MAMGAVIVTVVSFVLSFDTELYFAAFGFKMLGICSHGANGWRLPQSYGHHTDA